MKGLKRLAGGLRNSLGALSPNCREASRLLSDSMDRPLPFLKRIGLQIHLVLCRWCRRYGKQIRFLRCASREHPDRLSAAASTALSPEACERLKKALRKETEQN